MGIHASLEKDRFRLLSSPNIRRRPSGEKIASSSVSLTECSAGSGRPAVAQSRAHTLAHTRARMHALAHESPRTFPRKSPLPDLRFPPDHGRGQPSRSLSCAVCGVLFTSDGRARGPSGAPLPIPRVHTSDHPHPGLPIHHAVVCRPCVLPHTTYVGRHATSAHAHPAAAAAATAAESASRPVALLPPRARTRPRAASRVAAARGRR